MGLSSRGIGLPGQNRGAKARYYFVLGNSDGYCGRKHKAIEGLSKACAEAYSNGWHEGVNDRARKIAKESAERSRKC